MAEGLQLVVHDVWVGQPVTGAANPATTCPGPVDEVVHEPDLD